MYEAAIFFALYCI